MLVSRKGVVHEEGTFGSGCSGGPGLDGGSGTFAGACLARRGGLGRGFGWRIIAGAVIGGIASNAYAYGPGYGYYGPGYGYYGGYAPAYYGGYSGYYGGGYAPAYYGGYYGGSYPVVRYRRVIRPAYAYYGGPRFYGPRYYRGYYRRW